MTKAVLITGSSSGIGRATVEHFAQRDWQVAATMRRPDSVSAWADRPNIHVISLDVTDSDSIRAAVAAAIEQCDRRGRQQRRLRPGRSVRSVDA